MHKKIVIPDLDLLTRREQESIKALLKGALVFFYVEERIEG